MLDDESTEVMSKAIEYQKELISQGLRVRLEVKPKRLNLLLETMKANGFDRFGLVSAESNKPELKSID